MLNRKLVGGVRAAVAGAVIGIVSLGLGGCSSFSPEQAQVLRDQAAELYEKVEQEVGQLEKLRETFPAGSIEHSELGAAVEMAKARAQALSAVLVRADLVLDEINSPTDGLTVLARGAGPWLPEPIRWPAVLGAALVATLARAHQLKKGGVSIASSVEKAMTSDPDLRVAFDRNAPTVRSVQTPTGARLVDEATKPGRMLRLPI